MEDKNKEIKVICICGLEIPDENVIIKDMEMGTTGSFYLGIEAMCKPCDRVSTGSSSTLKRYDAIQVINDYIQSIKKMEFDRLGVTQIQDDEGDWYWIPNDKLDQFLLDIKETYGFDYMDKPLAFEKITERYGQYKTGGDRNNRPSIFN